MVGLAVRVTESPGQTAGTGDGVIATLGVTEALTVIVTEGEETDADDTQPPALLIISTDITSPAFGKKVYVGLVPAFLPLTFH